MTNTYEDYLNWLEAKGVTRHYLERKRKEKCEELISLIRKTKGEDAGWYLRYNPNGKEVRISNFYNPDEEQAMLSCFMNDNREFMLLYFPEYY